MAQGCIAADAQPTDAQLIEFIFHPGFSTASRVTQISGLGVGMDVVRSEIATLGGRVEVASTRGKGTTFMLYLPLTLAVAQAVLVRAGGRLWALPAPMVEQVQQIKAETLVSLYVAAKSTGRDASIRSTTCRGCSATPRTIRRRSATTRCCCCAPGRVSRRCTSTR